MNYLARMILVTAVSVTALSAAHAQGFGNQYAQTQAAGGWIPGLPNVATSAFAGPGGAGANARAAGDGFNRASSHAISGPGISQSHGHAVHQGWNSFGTSSSSAMHSGGLEQSFSTVIQGNNHFVGGSVSGSITFGDFSRSYSQSFGYGAGSGAASGNGFGGSAARSSVGY